MITMQTSARQLRVLCSIYHDQAELSVFNT